MDKKILTVGKYIYLVCLIFSFSCTRNRPHSNPYDPQNPSTGGNTGGYGTIIGTVKSVSGAPISYSNIYVDNTTVSAKTDSSGNYTISNIAVGTHTIKATRNSDVNSRTKEQTITMKPNETIKVDFNFDYNILSSSLNGNYSGDDYKLEFSNSPYTVIGDVFLGNVNDSVVIDSGVIIKFVSSYYLFISATNILANGTSANPIKFTSGKGSPSTGDYKSVGFGALRMSSSVPAYTIILNYVIFEYGSFQSIYGESDSKITNCTFANNNSDYVALYSQGEIKNCNFQKTDLSIVIYGSPTISYCNVIGYIYVNNSAGQYKINYCNLTRGSGTILNNNANYTIDATNNWWGTTNSSTIASYISSSAGSVSYSPYASSSISGAGPQ